MRQKSGTRESSSERLVKNIRQGQVQMRSKVTESLVRADRVPTAKGLSGSRRSKDRSEHPERRTVLEGHSIAARLKRRGYLFAN